MASYAEVYDASIRDPEGFWGRAAAELAWEREPTRVCDTSRAPFTRWFPDGRLNTCHNAVDRHVEAGAGARPAVIWDSPVTGRQRTLTYAELRDEVATLAGALAGLGVGRGDAVVISMPMVPEALIAMLACARLGAIHSVVFGGFAARELAVRIDDVTPTVVLSASCGIEPSGIVAYKPLLDRALEIADHHVRHCVILQRPEHAAELVPGRDRDWHDVVAAAEPVGCTPVAATDPLYVLYTSGTTGRPKGVVRDNGGHAAALRWSMTGIYDVGPGQVMWTASDVGWVVGHSYIVYGPLLAGATTVVYEGKPVGTPDAGAFWRVVAEHGVRALFTAPTAFRAIKQADPDGALLAGHDLSRFAALFLAGERLDPDTLSWAADLLGVPVLDHWWQTETGWPVAANPVGVERLPVKPGSATKPMPGWALEVLDPDGEPVPPGTDGALCARLPLPPGALTTVWGDDRRFVDGYLSRYDGSYLTGDGGHIDADGYVFVMGRTDDVVNVAGHRLSAGAIEEVLAAHPAVAECAVIGVADPVKGATPQGLVVLKAGVDIEPDALQAELVAAVRAEIGPVAAFKRVSVVDRLPKTRSGKILRSTMRALAEGRTVETPATIDDPAVLDELAETLSAPRV